MFKVMQQCETGEVFCAKEVPSMKEGLQWIEENAHQYPESTFFVEYSIEDLGRDYSLDLAV